jgi:NAD-dependent deacetylase
MPEAADALNDLGRALQGAASVVYLCGAGLSVPSGIRAYRSGPNAVWSELVTDWGTQRRFLADPAAWWATFWLKAHGDLFQGAAPNPGHQALVRLMGRSPKDLVITQNIDGLHRAAGHPEAQLIEVHGRHDRFCCTSQGCEGVVERVELAGLSQGLIPRCERCEAPLRPAVLLFDEHYDSHPLYQAHRARKALNAAEVIVFVGTSFSVGITSYALRCADVSGGLAFNLNLEVTSFPRLVNVLGAAEQLLPTLAARVLESQP